MYKIWTCRDLEKSSCRPLFPEVEFEDKVLKNVTGIPHVKGFLVVLVICLFVFRLISFSPSALFCTARGCSCKGHFSGSPMVWFGPWRQGKQTRGYGGLSFSLTSGSISNNGCIFFVAPTISQTSPSLLGEPSSWAGVFIIYCRIINYLETSQLKTTKILLSHTVPEV